MKKVLISYANARYFKSQNFLEETAKEIGKVDDVKSYTDTWLKTTDFWKKNQFILSRPRGAGYWAWKSYIILETFKELDNDDIVMYSDAGLSVIDNLSPLFKIASGESNNGKILFQIPDGHLIKTWTKRDTYILMEADEPKYYNRIMVNGALSLWKKSDENIEFLKKWLRYCRDPRIITDDQNMCGKPNLLEFKDHRHDQSVISIMAVKNNMEVFRDPTQWGEKEKDQFQNSPYGQLFNHHRGKF